MVEKRYVPGCGSSCLRCWRNRLKHANPNADLSKGLEVLGKTEFVWKEVPDKPIRPHSRQARRLADQPVLTDKQTQHLQHKRRSRNLAKAHHYEIPKTRLVKQEVGTTL